MHWKLWNLAIAFIPGLAFWLYIKDVGPEGGSVERIPKNIHLREWAKELETRGESLNQKQRSTEENVQHLLQRVTELESELKSVRAKEEALAREEGGVQETTEKRAETTNDEAQERVRHVNEKSV